MAETTDAASDKTIGPKNFGSSGRPSNSTNADLSENVGGIDNKSTVVATNTTVTSATQVGAASAAPTEKKCVISLKDTGTGTTKVEACQAGVAQKLGRNSTKPYKNRRNNSKNKSSDKVPVKNTKNENSADESRETEGRGCDQTPVVWDRNENNISGQLVDWNGNWLPAPVDWEFRSKYTYVNYFELITHWAEEHCRLSNSVGVSIGQEALESFGFGIYCGDWIPKQIDAHHPKEFWNRLKVSDPEPIWPEDLESSPWWQQFPSQLPLVSQQFVPEAKLDPSDECFGQAEKDKGSKHLMDQWAHRKKATKRKRMERMRAYQREQELAELAGPQLQYNLDKSIKAKLNLYVRPALVRDVFQITEIYNWHLRNSYFGSESQPRTVEFMRGLINTAEDSQLPFLVAVGKGRQIYQQEEAVTPLRREEVVGFAYGADYDDQNGVFGRTSKIQILVRNQCFRMGVGSCLLDRLTFLLDPMYTPRGGYDWNEKGDRWQKGGSRPMNNALWHVPCETHNEDEQGIVRGWLRNFGYHPVAEIPYIGVKLDKQ